MNRLRDAWLVLIGRRTAVVTFDLDDVARELDRQDAEQEAVNEAAWFGGSTHFTRGHLIMSGPFGGRTEINFGDPAVWKYTSTNKGA